MGLTGSATASITSGDLELWVSVSSGSDDRVGNSADSPLATLSEALRRLPDIIAHNVVIHIEGDHDIPRIQKVLIGRLTLHCDGAGQGGDGFNELVSPLQVDSQGAATAELNFPAGSFVAGDLEGKTLEILDGDAAGDRRTIRSNGTATIQAIADFSSAVQAGDRVRVVEPLHTLNWSDGFVITATGSGARYPMDFQTIDSAEPALVFVNAIFDSPSGRFFASDSLMEWHGVEVVGIQGGLRFQGSTVRVGGQTDAEAPAGAELGAPSDQSWIGWGLYFRTSMAVTRCTVTGYMVCDFGMSVSSDAEVSLVGSFVRDFGLGVNDQSVLRTAPSSNDIACRIVETTGNAVEVNDQAKAFLGEHTDIESDAACVYAVDGGWARLEGNCSLVSNNDASIESERGGTVYFDGSSISITSSTVDTRTVDPSGANQTQALGGYGAAGDFIQAADGSKIQRNV